MLLTIGVEVTKLASVDKLDMEWPFLIVLAGASGRGSLALIVIIDVYFVIIDVYWWRFLVSSTLV